MKKKRNETEVRICYFTSHIHLSKLYAKINKNENERTEKKNKQTTFYHCIHSYI